MAWVYLVIAGIFEITWAVCLKQSNSLKMNYTSIILLASMVFSVVFLSLAMKSIPMGTAYAVWTGIGIIGTVIYGAYILGEPISLMRVLYLAMILVGIIGLKIT
jgi:quaternary ammonium compound-resistance protein SugE